MQFLELTLPTLEENLALDEALLLEAEAGRGGELLRLWEWPDYAVVLGAGCRLADDVDESACAADGVPIRRRSSGGGTVLLGRGCLLYSLVLTYARATELREIRPSYQWILGRVRETLTDLGPRIEVAGISDLCVAGKKFSGNSQQRKRDYLLHHGTLLYGFDLEKVSHYLREPGRQPEYRAQRRHAEFMANLAVPRAALVARVRTAWSADSALVAWPEIEVRRLIEERYASADWIRRR